MIWRLAAAWLSVCVVLCGGGWASAPAFAESGAAVLQDAHGFGDDQFVRMTGGQSSASVPSLAAIYDTEEKARPAASAQTARLDGWDSFAAVVHGAPPSGAPLARARLSSSFGTRLHPILGGYRVHKGVDLAASAGSPIFATADGVVEQAAWAGGYGLTVQLLHPGGIETRYAHMQRLNVAPGVRVRKGDTIGYVGSTGRSTGPHLHYEVLVKGRAVNPLSYLRR